MEAENIFQKIEKIMREFELIENEEIHESNKYSEKSDSHLNEEYVPSFMTDEFLSFLYKNIHIEHQEPVNTQEQTNNSSSLHNNNNNNPIYENKIPSNSNEEFSNQTHEFDNHTQESDSNNNPPANETEYSHPLPKSILQQWIDKYYKKIAIKCHPDKVKDKVKQSLFLKTQMYKEQCFLIGILYQCMILKIELDPLPSTLIQRICEEIRITQEKMIRLRSKTRKAI